MRRAHATFFFSIIIMMIFIGAMKIGYSQSSSKLDTLKMEKTALEYEISLLEERKSELQNEIVLLEEELKEPETATGEIHDTDIEKEEP